MSLHELRSQLREHRKLAVPPVSRMKKADVVAELERMKVKHEKKVEKELSDEEEDVKRELKKEKVSKKVAEKVVAVEKKEHKKQVKEMKKEDAKEMSAVEKKSPSIKLSRKKE